MGQTSAQTFEVSPMNEFMLAANVANFLRGSCQPGVHVLADTATNFSRVTDGRLCMKPRVAPVGERSVSFTAVQVRIEGR